MAISHYIFEDGIALCYLHSYNDSSIIFLSSTATNFIYLTLPKRKPSTSASILYNVSFLNGFCNLIIQWFYRKTIHS